MRFFQPHLTPFISESTLCSPKITITPLSMLSLPTQCEWIYFLCNLRIFAFNVVQTKERNYHNQHLADQFLPLTIEVFGSLHKHANMFLHDCVHVIWSLKELKSLHLFVLVTFLYKKVSITLQRMQASSILSWAIVIGLTTFQLPLLQDTPPITIANLL